MQLHVATITGQRDQKGYPAISKYPQSWSSTKHWVFKSPKWVHNGPGWPTGFLGLSSDSYLGHSLLKRDDLKTFFIFFQRLMRVFVSDCGYVSHTFEQSKSYLISWHIITFIDIGRGEWESLELHPPKKQQQEASLAIATWLGSRIFTSEWFLGHVFSASQQHPMWPSYWECGHTS